MRSTVSYWMILLLLLAVDFYVFVAIKSVSQSVTDKTRLTINIAYWVCCMVAIAFIIAYPYNRFLSENKIFRNYVFAIIVGIFFAKLAACIFLLLDDIRRLLLWVMAKLFTQSGVDFVNSDGTVSRSAFLSWLGLGVGSGLFVTLLAGFRNKYRYQVRKLSMHFPTLPLAFKGLRIVQISDIHSGSFTNKKEVEEGINLILKQNADVIFFTGDLVNDRHEEMLPYMDIFNKIKAPMGVFSILGNHDYGDYVSWPNEAAKKDNLQKLKEVHHRLGWRLLMNEHVLLEKNEVSIAVLGIENWSAFGRFPKYGRLENAYKGTETYPFKILLSHDPSHWDAEVCTAYPDIQLMLSGHTHGMQFGLENPYFKWSPVQWFYKQWAGLYQKGEQKLYVNRGFGFIGYPGRVGILPEITLIELK
jgi:predicted MPP superfamily phosphohydrolase